MELDEVLQILGLNQKSSQLYLAALELGETLIKPLAKHANLKRPTLYELLPQLHELGLISFGRIGKRRTVIAQDPAKLLYLQEEKLKTIKGLMPQLLSRYNRTGERPKVFSYEGVEGIKQVYEDTLAEEFPMRSFLETGEVNSEIDDYLAKNYMPRRARRGIRIKNLVSGSPGEGEHLLTTKGYYRDNRYLDQQKYPAKIEMMIYGNRVAFVTYAKHSQPMGIIIESAEIAETLRSLHEIGWEKGRPVSADDKSS